MSWVHSLEKWKISILSLLINSVPSVARATREASVPIQITQNDYLAPQVNEIKGYFITICLALLAFFAKEIYSYFRNRNSTVAQDLIDLKKNDMILMNKIDMIMNELKHKPDRDEMLKEMLNLKGRE
jgi:hypothetical protein